MINFPLGFYHIELLLHVSTIEVDRRQESCCHRLKTENCLFLHEIMISKLS